MRPIQLWNLFLSFYGSNCVIFIRKNVKRKEYILRLEWEGCDNWFNTPDCFTPEFDLSCDGIFEGISLSTKPHYLFCQSTAIHCSTY